MIDNNDIDTRLWDHYLTFIDYDGSFDKANEIDIDESVGEDEIILTKSIVTRRHPKNS